MTWDEASIETLKALRRQGLSFGEIGKAIGCSRNCVCGAVQRHIHNHHGRRARYRAKSYLCVSVSAQWTETALTEPYAAFKARKQAERAAARP